MASNKKGTMADLDKHAVIRQGSDQSLIAR